MLQAFIAHNGTSGTGGDLEAGWTSTRSSLEARWSGRKISAVGGVGSRRPRGKAEASDLTGGDGAMPNGNARTHNGLGFVGEHERDTQGRRKG